MTVAAKLPMTHNLVWAGQVGVALPGTHNLVGPGMWGELPSLGLTTLWGPGMWGPRSCRRVLDESRGSVWPLQPSLPPHIVQPILRPFVLIDGGCVTYRRARAVVIMIMVMTIIVL